MVIRPVIGGHIGSPSPQYTAKLAAASFETSFSYLITIAYFKHLNTGKAAIMAACFQAIGTQGVRYAVAPRDAPGSLASADTADRNVFAGVCITTGY